MGSQFKAISRQDVRPLSRSRSSTAVSANNVAQLLRQFTFNGVPTVEAEENGLRYFINEFWTSGQRQAHSLHEISYRACFKPQLPDFFISRLTEPREAVYDPFSGRGTTAVQAALLGRRPVANDVNPLSAILVQPRLDPPCITEIRARLKEIDFERVMPADTDRDLTVFYHPVTLRQICALRGYLLEGEARGRLDRIDQWIRMVAINRLTGHSPGFFSVYTLPPNQAVSVEAQRKINEARQQIPPPRDIAAIIMKKSKSLLDDGAPPSHPPAFLTSRPAFATPEIRGIAAALIVTSPPFLDVVD